MSSLPHTGQCGVIDPTHTHSLSLCELASILIHSIVTSSSSPFPLPSPSIALPSRWRTLPHPTCSTIPTTESAHESADQNLVRVHSLTHYDSTITRMMGNSITSLNATSFKTYSAVYQGTKIYGPTQMILILVNPASKPLISTGSN